MPATDSELASMDDAPIAEDEKGGGTDVSSAAPPADLPALPPPLNTISNFTGEAEMENRAVSMASNDCSASLSSPTEASPAKPAVNSPTTCEGTQTSPPTSHIASASDSLESSRTDHVNIADSAPLLSIGPSATFGSPNQENDFSSVLTCKGITVTLENNCLWKDFYTHGNEMIITKQGRRMFPFCRYRVSGLDPDRLYAMVLSLAPSDMFRYRWTNYQWEKNGIGQNQTQGPVQAFAHQYSTCKGSDWMGTWVSFYKLKLTNNPQDQGGNIFLHSLHRYIPRLHLIPVPDGDLLTSDQPLVMGPDSITFTFPQTEFMAVTTYQNFRITQLKIKHNPFAKSFREDGHYRQNKVTTEAPTQAPAVVKIDLQSIMFLPNESKEGVVHPSTTNHVVSTPVSAPVINVKETRLVLKPIMWRPSINDNLYVTCARGNHALGELVLVDKPSPVGPKENSVEVSVTPKLEPHSKATSATPTPRTSTPASSPRMYRRRGRMKRRVKSPGSEWKPPTRATTTPTATHGSSLTLALQPELDDVEGMLFVSFTSKEALKVHTQNTPASYSTAESPVSPTTTIQVKQKEELNPETEKEKIGCMEALLLQDLKVFKHRQVIHPVLQEVGMKLSSLDPHRSVDLQYLGVDLPIPPANQPDEANSTAPALADLGQPFISRTGKTSDMTKIKGWKNKLIRNKETPLNNDGLQKNLSAFCSDMLDEYLESEAQQISERAAAFSTNPEGSVAYRLPAKGSSYVKTLDSALKHRNASSTRPCPQSHSTNVSPPTPAPSTIADGANAASGSRDASIGSSRSSTQQKERLTVFIPQTCTRADHKLSHMEVGALKQGLSRTHLTHDRLKVALSSLLTKQMDTPGAKVLSYPGTKSAPCGQEFCILGCVCSSLQQKNRGPFHCGRPECMSECSCFKHRITKRISPAMTNGEHVVQPRRGFHTNKLWSLDLREEDSEPLMIPLSHQHSVLAKCQRKPLKEEDKDPVYKYLESRMTCARVRPYDSAPPPQLHMPNASIAKPLKKPIVNLTNTKQTETVGKADNQTSHKSSHEKEAKKQIQIQSNCRWQKDHKSILKVLCRRMNQDQLHESFRVGPYLISPVTKIFVQRPSGSHITYRVRINKSLQTSDNEDRSDDPDEENHVSKSNATEIKTEEQEHGLFEGENTSDKVTPFLSGVLPAGHLTAKPKPIDSPPSSLVQVNGKSYYQVRLLLGRMGSLHPANRLAAYVTGRHSIPADFVQKKPESTPKTDATVSEQAQPTNTAVPQVATANKTSELRTTPPPLVLNNTKRIIQGPFHPASWGKGSNTFPEILDNPTGFNPLHDFISSQLRSGGAPQNSSAPSPVSLTVSPSLKTPSFLTESGTYSFRICPPASQNTGNQNQLGVSLPGGFTLIELPKKTKTQETEKTTNVPALQKLLSQKDSPCVIRHRSDGFDPNGLESNISSKSGSTESGSSSKPVSGESDDVSDRPVASESSDDSDYCRDVSDLDIVMVNVDEEGKILTEMKEAAQNKSHESSDAKRYVVSGWGTNSKDVQAYRKRIIHSSLEKHRRSEQRDLFDRLHLLLGGDAKITKPPRLYLLTLAEKEIRALTSEYEFLKEKKKMLIKTQLEYVKQLSAISGKSEVAIRHKLRDICEKQKIKEKTAKFTPFFSQLLQSRAALLQNETDQPPSQTPFMFLSKSQPQSQSLLQSRSPPQSQLQAQSQPQQATFIGEDSIRLHSSVQSIPVWGRPNPQTPTTFHPPATSSPLDLTAPSSERKNQAASGAPDPFATPTAQSQVPGRQTTPPSITAHQTVTQAPINPPMPVSLPLIRSKTGRLILPSYIKPNRPGYFTLMVVDAQQKDGAKGRSTSAETEKSTVDGEKQEEKTVSIPDLPSTSKSSSASDQDKHVSSNSDPKPPCPTSRQNNSGVVPTNRTGGQATYLQFIPLSQIHTLETCSNPTEVSCHTGAPPEAPGILLAGDETGKDVSTPLPDEANQNATRSLTLKKGANGPAVACEAADSPVPAKRGRGRPPKTKQDGPPKKRGPSKSDRDSPVKLSYHHRRQVTQTSDTAASNTPLRVSRPLTRGAMGKDFPSAKKRSWIDIEKELDPEVESD